MASSAVGEACTVRFDRPYATPSRLATLRSPVADAVSIPAGPEIVAIADLPKRVFRIDVGRTPWRAIPSPSDLCGPVYASSSLYSTRYRIFRAEEETPIATVSYQFSEDNILIESGLSRWKTETNSFGPSHILYEGTDFTIVETVTGKFIVLGHGQPVIRGWVRSRTVTIESHPAKISVFATCLATGFLMRTLLNELAG